MINFTAGLKKKKGDPSEGFYSRRILKSIPVRWNLDFLMTLPATSLPFPPVHSPSFHTTSVVESPRAFVLMGQKLLQLDMGLLPFLFLFLFVCFCLIRALKKVSTIYCLCHLILKGHLNLRKMESAL